MILIQAIRNAMVNVPIEQTADAVGHSGTRTTEVVYGHRLYPVTRTAAIALGPLSEGRGRPTEAKADR